MTVALRALVVNDVATVLQAIASVLFAIIETHSRKIYLCLTGASNHDDDDDDDKWLIGVETADILAFIRIFDAVFLTVAELPTDQDETCLSHERLVMWFMYALLLLVWFMLLAIVVINGFKRDEIKCEWRFLFFLFALFIFISSAFLLIGSNNEPLGCSYSCDLYHGNMTETCGQKAFHETRVSLLTVALVLISVPSIGLVFY